jgi:hypothetical protein
MSTEQEGSQGDAPHARKSLEVALSSPHIANCRNNFFEWIWNSASENPPFMAHQRT